MLAFVVGLIVSAGVASAAPGVPTPLLPQDVEAWQDSCASQDRGQMRTRGRSSGPSLRIRPRRPGPNP